MKEEQRSFKRICERASLILCVALLCPFSAHAYVVYSTSDVTPPETCILPQPQKLLWEGDDILFWVEPPSLNESEEAIEVIKKSYFHWNNGVGCGQPSLTYAGIQEDPSQGGTLPVVGYEPSLDEANQNLLVWVENPNEWVHGPGVLGLTTLTYNTCDGTIVDGDIEINGGEFLFSVSGVPEANEMDLENTVTHEVGHLLGLDHSQQVGATMFFNSPEGETEKRSPEVDDWAGLCCLYCVPGTHVPNNVCEGGVEQCLDEGLINPGSLNGNSEEMEDEGGCDSTQAPFAPLALLFILLFGLRTNRECLQKQCGARAH